MILMIDNYDSFTYNLVQYLGEMSQELKVFRNDKISIEEIEALNPERIVISPGPCTPKEAGISVDVIKHFAGKLPILGVCLGHQAIGQAFGGEIVKAERLMHGKVSNIVHDNQGVFKDVPNPLVATRYHSLIIKKETKPECLKITAATKEGEIMGVRHVEYQIEGVQFHPESILTQEGKKILQNFVSFPSQVKKSQDENKSELQ
ncbi:MAG: aminodeoxychorismate/anthranilate synthase component II [Armatimonadota bacterium]